MFFSESQDHKIASFPKESYYLVFSPDKKDFTLKVLWVRQRCGLTHHTSLQTFGLCTAEIFSQNVENEDFNELKDSLPLLLLLIISMFKEGASQLDTAFRHNFLLHAVAQLQSFGGLQPDYVMLWLCILLLD